jgi:hypothetical protein
MAKASMSAASIGAAFISETFCCHVQMKLTGLGSAKRARHCLARDCRNVYDIRLVNGNSTGFLNDPGDSAVQPGERWSGRGARADGDLWDGNREEESCDRVSR